MTEAQTECARACIYFAWMEGFLRHRGADVSFDSLKYTATHLILKTENLVG